MARPRTRSVSQPDAFSLLGVRWPTSWSSSRWDMYAGCPRQYLLNHVKKFNVAPANSAMERGTTIHMQAEQYLLGKTRGLPDSLDKFADEFATLKRLGANPEAEWVLTRKFAPTYWKDWGGAWIRSKLDAHHHFKKENELLIIDFKTGKFKPKLSQMSLYASISQFFIPADEVDVELWFLDHGEPFKEKYSRSKIKEQWKKWVERADRMLAAREFPHKAGPQCDWCAYRSNRKMTDGQPGPCEGWRER